eukprot:CAMPEP_0114609198 /NCGR_PEP_ID=MMETSP0168-20121206/2966_1 /TAXON_ID=95228 ORGANISM="Vannella sp., Strain DIVA3 517/6/12" /NCGR_SAMPLE_ID=MMETSP0168 /ASSEMBLY_ACC=CAM_ASM_000044 /LENGTH=879 /DNA_ID=CAMNT_0001820111 /DNA_START=44 /DNA_END=2680 /DNA_ORIENTATION=-
MPGDQAPNLADYADGSVSTLGGKGLRLWEMIRNGFPIPPAATVLSAVYDEHVARSDDVKQLIRKVLDAPVVVQDKVGSDAAMEADLAKLREMIIAQPLADACVEDLKAFIATLPKGSSIAVRSSGTLEDKIASSYAGQYDTFLHNRTLDEVMISIKECWASCWQSHVLQYRHLLKELKEDPSMAVVIQLQVDSHVSGVLFTCNPLNSNSNEMTVESAWGQGEGVVSGTVSPDRFVLSRFPADDSEEAFVLNKAIAPKQVKIILARGDVKGVEEVKTTEEECNGSSLSTAALRNLVVAGEKIMLHYGHPQDIEFAFDAAGELFVLQARAITKTILDAGKGGAEKKERLVFAPPGDGNWKLDSTHFASPLTRYIQPLIVAGIAGGFNESMDVTGMVLNMFTASVNNFLFTQAAHEKDPAKVKDRFAAADSWWADRRYDAVCEEWERVKEETVRQHVALQSTDLATLSDADLIAHLGRCSEWQGRMHHQHHKYTASSLLPVGDYLVKVSAWTGASMMEMLSLLEGASPVSRGLLAEEQVARLRAAFRDDKEAAALLRSSTPAGEVIDTLRKKPGAVGELIQQFITNNGYRLIHGYDVSAPVLLEQPELLAKGILVALDEDQAVDSEKIQARIAAIRAKVPDDEKEHFDRLLDIARKMYRLREERGLYSDIWAAGISRYALLEAGRRAQARGLLDCAKKVVDASLAEVEALLLGPAENAVTKEELERRAHFRTHYSASDCPAFLGPESPPPDAAKMAQLPPALQRSMAAMGAVQRGIFARVDSAKNENEIAGAGASAGVYEGTARIILDPDDFSKLRKGDVLVTFSTSAAFNVVLPLVGAVVTDFGGILSHAAIVAREYGIPSVVSCQTAVSRIEDGALVRVD